MRRSVLAEDVNFLLSARQRGIAGHGQRSSWQGVFLGLKVRSYAWSSPSRT